MYTCLGYDQHRDQQSNTEPSGSQSNLCRVKMAERTMTEVIVRTVATQLFALANYGHFCSLLSLPGDLHAGYVFVFFFNPAIVSGQLVAGVLQAIQYLKKSSSRGAGWLFYLHAILGARVSTTLGLDGAAENEGETISLFQAGHSLVEASCVPFT